MIRSQQVAFLIGVGFAGTLAILWLWNRRKRNKDGPSVTPRLTREAEDDANSSRSGEPVGSGGKACDRTPLLGSCEQQETLSSQVCGSMISTDSLRPGKISTATSMESLFVNPRESPLQRLSDCSDVSDEDDVEELEYEFLNASSVGVWLYDPPRHEDDPDRVQLMLPSYLVASFIGKNGRHIKAMEQTGASVKIISKSRGGPSSNRTKEEGEDSGSVCNITGRHGAVVEVLQEVAKRFPGLAADPLRWPVDRASATRHAVSPPSYVSFENDLEKVTVSHVQDPHNLWLQLMERGHLNALERLNDAMTWVYSAPQAYVENALGRDVPVGGFCAAPLGNLWLRARLLWRGEERNGEEEAQVLFVDFGSTTQVPVACLMQLRAEFFILPFQALHCRLASISPLQASEWPMLAKTLLKSYLDGASTLLHARVVGEQGGVLCIELYQGVEPNVLFINRDLVERRCAQWVEADSN